MEHQLTYPKPVVALGAGVGEVTIGGGDAFGLLIVDRPLPDGDSEKVIQSFRQSNPNAPVIVMSEEFDPKGDMGFYARHSKADGAFPKPMLSTHFLNALKQVKVTPWQFR